MLDPQIQTQETAAEGTVSAAETVVPTADRSYPELSLDPSVTSQCLDDRTANPRLASQDEQEVVALCKLLRVPWTVVGSDSK